MTEQNIFYFTLAGVNCQIRTKDQRIFQLLNKYYQNKPAPKKTEVTLFVDVDQKKPFIIKIKNKIGYISYPKYESFDKISFFLKFLLQLFFIKHGVLFLHGSSFVKNGRAYVFCGPSGIGKSTIIKNVKKKSILSDDIAVLQKKGHQLYVFPSFFERKFIPSKLSKQTPLESIFVLKQSLKTVKIKLRFPASFEAILSNTILFEYFSINKKGGGLKNSPKNQIKNEILELNRLTCLFILQLLATVDIMILKNKKGDDVFKKIDNLLWEKS